jgi:hypothetical protein
MKMHDNIKAVVVITLTELISISSLNLNMGYVHRFQVALYQPTRIIVITLFLNKVCIFNHCSYRHVKEKYFITSLNKTFSVRAQGNKLILLIVLAFHFEAKHDSNCPFPRPWINPSLGCGYAAVNSICR